MNKFYINLRRIIISTYQCNFKNITTKITQFIARNRYLHDKTRTKLHEQLGHQVQQLFLGKKQCQICSINARLPGDPGCSDENSIAHQRCIQVCRAFVLATRTDHHQILKNNVNCSTGIYT